MAAAESTPWILPASADLPFVGRERERAVLPEVLGKVKAGQGACWVAEGPGGIGKTRLVRGVADQAEQEGFEVRWTYGRQSRPRAARPSRCPRTIERSGRTEVHSGTLRETSR